MCTLLPGAALAGPWEAPGPQGLVVRIGQDAARTRDGYVLERVYPDGSVDATFGDQGRSVFSLGPDNEGPATLRVDAQGRVWVVGASLGADGRTRAVVLRFGAQGRPDPSYAQGGRSAVAPAGQQARALDLAPLPDGSALVAGQLIDAQGAERTGWWRLRSDGTVDPTFGLGGAWTDRSPGSTEALEVAQAPDGSAALLLRRDDGKGAAWLETWLLAPGATVPVPGARLANELHPALNWQAAQRQWTLGGARPAASVAASAAAVAPAASAATTAAEPLRTPSAAELALPYGTVASAAAAEAKPHGGLSWGGPWAWIGLALAGALAAGVWFTQRSRHAERTQRTPHARRGRATPDTPRPPRVDARRGQSPSTGADRQGHRGTGR